MPGGKDSIYLIHLIIVVCQMFKIFFNHIWKDTLNLMLVTDSISEFPKKRKMNKNLFTENWLYIGFL